IEEWKTAYANADPGEKGFMIGQLIGETISLILDAGGAIKNVTELAKFIRDGGFKKAFKKAINMSKSITNLIEMTPADLVKKVKKIIKVDDGYKVVLKNDEIMNVPYDKLSHVERSKFDSLVDQLKKKKGNFQYYSLDEEIDDENERSTKLTRNISNTSELNPNLLDDLEYNGTIESGGRSGGNRPLDGLPNSYVKTKAGHTYVYDSEGKLIYDISSKRVKMTIWDKAPNGIAYPRDVKLIGSVPKSLYM
uniref:hypothetical protein n=1 Tax=Vallitalea guaymasensis TaxID=1185412 RepID=UPI0027297DC4